MHLAPEPAAACASRLNRRLQALADWLALLTETLGELFARGQATVADFVIDSMPVPVCRRVRGRISCGHCAAKKEPFFGWRLHLVCTTGGIPVAFRLLPASCHDLTPVHALTAGLPPAPGSTPTRLTTAPPTRPASGPTPASAWSRGARSPWPPTPRPSTPASAPIAPPSRPSTASWQAWASSVSTPAPTPGASSRLSPPSSPSPAPTPPSNHRTVCSDPRR